MSHDSNDHHYNNSQSIVNFEHGASRPPVECASNVLSLSETAAFEISIFILKTYFYVNRLLYTRVRARSLNFRFFISSERSYTDLICFFLYNEFLNNFHKPILEAE
jgi:hypothetical protein